MTPELHPMG